MQMRTTLTLDPDSRLLIERAMRDRGLTFKEAVNDAIRRGLAPAVPVRSPTSPRRMGRPRVDLTKALSVAADLEDEAIVQRLHDGR